MREVKVRNRFRYRQESVYIVSLRKHLESYVPGSHTIFQNEPEHLCLPVLECAEIAVEEFFVVANRLAMPAVNEGR